MGIFSKAEQNVIFETSYIGFYVRVYPDRVDFKAKAGKQSIGLNQIASIETGMVGMWQIVIETSGGQKYKVPCRQKEETKKAIFSAKTAASQSHDSSSHISSVADELAKLADLHKQGLLTVEEFQEQKKKLLK